MISFKYAVFISTVIVFTCESLLHYNIGKNGLTTLQMPNLIEAIEIFGVVLVFSGINALLSKYIFTFREEDESSP